MNSNTALMTQLALADPTQTHEMVRDLLAGMKRVRGQSHLEHRFVYECLSDQIGVGDTFYIEPGICDTLARAADTLPEFTLAHDLLLSPVGFVYLGKPLGMPGVSHRLKAFSWNLVRSDPARSADADRYMIFVVFWSGPSYPPVPCWVYLPRLEQAWNAMFTELHDAGVGAGSDMHFMSSLFSSFLLFVKQDFIVEKTESAGKSARKQLNRRQLTKEPIVRVIQLRRKATKYAKRFGNPVEVDWDHRWIVRGHWRNQFYRASKTHRPKWITPYIKGPEEKPLRPPSKIVYDVSR